jgi:hypothetical protein
VCFYKLDGAPSGKVSFSSCSENRESLGHPVTASTHIQLAAVKLSVPLLAAAVHPFRQPSLQSCLTQQLPFWQRWVLRGVLIVLTTVLAVLTTVLTQ